MLMITEREAVSYNIAIPAEQDIFSIPLAEPKIVILKGKRELLLYEQDQLFKSYQIGLGFSPEGDKEKQGDGKTPEGEFSVRVKNPDSAFHLSLGLDYPNTEDATRGFVYDLIDFGEYVSIINAINNKQMPPQETKLGGAIYIHGEGSDDDWTKGCVALENKDIEELFALVGEGATVEIRP